MKARAIVPKSLLVAAFVALLTILLGFLNGLRHTIAGPDTSTNWIVLSRGATEELRSYITSGEFDIVRARPEIATDSSGAALISREIVTGFDPRAMYATSRYTETYIRGVEPVAYRLHSEIQLLQGKWPTPDTNELVIGKQLSKLYPYFRPGEQIRFGTSFWRIVGVFSDRGSSRESEVWADFAALRRELQYSGYVNSVFVKLRSGQSSSFQRALEKGSDLFVETEPETTFRLSLTSFVRLATGCAIGLVVVLAVGCVFGVANALSKDADLSDAKGFDAIRPESARRRYREIATRGLAIGVLAGIEGALVSAALVHWSGVGSKSIEFGRFIFSCRLTPQTMAEGVMFGTFVGGMISILAMCAPEGSPQPRNPRQV